MITPEFSARNLRRCIAPDGFNHALSSWSLDDWLLAAAGELGEAMNVAKKLNRVRDKIPGNKETPQQLERMLVDELADCVIYLDLVAHSEGLSLIKAAEEARLSWGSVLAGENFTLSQSLNAALEGMGSAAAIARKMERDRLNKDETSRRHLKPILAGDIGIAAVRIGRIVSERGVDFMATIEAKFDETSRKRDYVETREITGDGSGEALPPIGNAVGAMTSGEGPACALAMAGGDPVAASQLWGDSER